MCCVDYFAGNSSGILLLLFGLVLIFKIGSHCVVQAGLKHIIPLPSPPSCWDYRCAQPCLASIVFL
jgi:hypothetical protein